MSGEIFTLVTGTFPPAITVNETVSLFVLSIRAEASFERVIFGSDGSRRTLGVPSVIWMVVFPSEDEPVLAVTEEDTPFAEEEYAFAESTPAKALEVELLALFPAADFELLEAALAAVEVLFDEEAALPEKVL